MILELVQWDIKLLVDEDQLRTEQNQREAKKK